MFLLSKIKNTLDEILSDPNKYNRYTIRAHVKYECINESAKAPLLFLLII